MSVSSFNNINILVGDYKMQINELVNESGNVNEAQPMGFLSKLGNKVAAGTGNLINKTTGITPNFSAQAQGRLNVGALANQVMAGYQKLLGQTGEQPTEASLLAYLQKKGYPLDNAKQVIAQSTQVDEPADDDITHPTPQEAGGPMEEPAPEQKPSVWSNARNPGVTGTSPAAVAPTAQESIRNILNMLVEAPSDTLKMNIVAKAIKAATQQHAGAQVQQAPQASQADPTDVAQPTSPEVGQAEPTADTPAAVRNAAAPTSNETDPQNNVNTTNATASNKQKVGVPQGRQAIDNAMQTVNVVRSDRRQDVIDYAKQSLDSAEQQLDSIRKNAGLPPAQADEEVPADNTIAFNKAAGQQDVTAPEPNIKGLPIKNMGE